MLFNGLIKIGQSLSIIIVTIIIISGGFFHSGFCWSKSSSSKGSTKLKTNVLLLIRSHSYWKWSICIYFPHRKDWLVLISGFYLGLVSAQNSHGFYMERFQMYFFSDWFWCNYVGIVKKTPWFCSTVSGDPIYKYLINTNLPIDRW